MLARQVKQLLHLARLWDALLPVVSLFVGAALVGRVDDSRLVSLVVVIILLNSVAIIWNDIEDRRIDADNDRPEVSRQTESQLRQLKISIGLLLSVSLCLAWIIGSSVGWLCIAAIVVTWAYNSRPFQASRRPIASIIVLSGAGALLPFLFGAALGELSSTVWIAGLYWWVGRISLSVLKDYKDVKGDAKHSKKTFLLRYGAQRVAWVSLLTFLLGYGLFIALLLHDLASTMLLCVAMALLVYMRRNLFDEHASYNALDHAFRQLVQYQLLLDVGVVAWLMF